AHPPEENRRGADPAGPGRPARRTFGGTRFGGRGVTSRAVIAVPVDSSTYFGSYGPMVLRRCQKLLGDEPAARDAMHDVFVQVLSHAEELSDQAPSSLLFRIATNVCL